MVQVVQNELVVVVGTRFRFVLVKNNENCVVLTLCVSTGWWGRQKLYWAPGIFELMGGASSLAFLLQMRAYTWQWSESVEADFTA